MFGRKKQSSERNPINLPELENNANSIFEELKNGHPVWGWISITETKDFGTIATFQNGTTEDEFGMFRKEDDYLCMYVAHFDNEMTMHLKLTEVSRFEYENVKRCHETYIKNFKKVYKDTEHLTEECLCFVHNVTTELLEEYLEGHKIFYVTEEYFPKKNG